MRTANSFRMRAYTGSPVSMPFWDNMVFDLDGMRTREKVPALVEHDRSKRAGVLTSFNVIDGQFICEGHYVDTEHAREVQELERQGFPWGCSVGIKIDAVQKIDDGELVEVNGRTLKGPLWVAREMNLGEVSFCTWAADMNTDLNKAANNDFWSLVSQHQKKADCSRADAIRYIVEIRPELHDRYVLSLSGQKPANVEDTKDESEFMTLVENYQRENNCSQGEAIRVVVTDYPEAHQQYIEDQRR